MAGRGTRLTARTWIHGPTIKRQSARAHRCARSAPEGRAGMGENAAGGPGPPGPGAAGARPARRWTGRRSRSPSTRGWMRSRCPRRRLPGHGERRGAGRRRRRGRRRRDEGAAHPGLGGAPGRHGTGALCQGRSPLRDLSGNAVASFAYRTADNRTPADAPAGPALWGATLAGTALTLAFDETLDAASVPAPGSFRAPWTARGGASPPAGSPSTEGA